MSDEPEDTTVIGDRRALTGLRPGRERAYVIVIAGPNVGEMFKLDQGGAIGRGDGCEFRIRDSEISRQHARIFQDGADMWIEDLGSTNGTFVNGSPVDRRALNDGDKIQIGTTTILKFSYHDRLDEEFQRQMYESAVRDPLCRVYNRRYLNERLEAEMAYALRHGTPLSAILVDVDHFKQVNDTKGHLAGDAVLRVLGTALKRMVRAEDLVARYGGEEFAIVTRGIDARNTMILAERIRRAIGNMAIPWEAGRLRITVSIGVATLCEGRSYPDVEALLSAADEALYEAKRAGRDRCMGASGVTPSTPAAASCPR